MTYKIIHEKIFLLLIILLTVNFVLADVYRTPREIEKMIDERLQYVRQTNIGNAEKIESYNSLINLIKTRISQISGNYYQDPGAVPVSNSCQKISQTLWGGNSAQSSTDILLLQNFLGKKMQEWNVKTDGDKDGIFGQNTITWVKEFQKRNGIAQTGAVGSKTLAKINSMICDGLASVTMCTQNYEPVCGKICDYGDTCSVTNVKPCPDITKCHKTFENICEAQKNNAKNIRDGECAFQ